MRKLVSVLLVAGLALSSCGLCHHIPSTSSTVNVIDSVAVHWIDSIRVTEKVVYRDYTSLLDTLRMNVEGRASMAAWVDTTRKEPILAGELKTEPVVEKVKYLYKDRIKEVHDTTTIQLPPIEKEVIKEVIPTMFWWSLGLNILFLLWLGWSLYLKFFKKGIK